MMCDWSKRAYDGIHDAKAAICTYEQVCSGKTCFCCSHCSEIRVLVYTRYVYGVTARTGAGKTEIGLAEEAHGLTMAEDRVCLATINRSKETVTLWFVHSWQRNAALHAGRLD